MRTEKHIIKNRYSTHGIHRNIPVYEMNTVHCSASPIEGYKGTEVTLIDDAAWNEKFSAWALTGATATGNNIILNNDVTAQGIYETAKNVTLQTDGGGTINSTKMSGFIGDQATLSNTPDATHVFSGYTITGATLTGSNFNFIGNDVTAKAWFKYFNTPLYTAAEITEGVSPNIYLSGKTDFVVVKFDELMLTDYYADMIPALNVFRISAMNTIMSFNVTPTMEGCNWTTGGVWHMAGKDINLGHLDTNSNLEITEDDLVEMAKDAFVGEGTGGKKKILIGGSNFVEALEKIKSEKFRLKGDVQAWDLTFNSWKTNFGEFLVIHCETMDKYGKSNWAFCLDPEYFEKRVLYSLDRNVLDLEAMGVRATQAVVLKEISAVVLYAPQAHARVKLYNQDAVAF